MLERKVYHLVPYGENWKIERENAQRAVKVFDDKKDAVDFGRDLAKNQNLGQLTIHKRDGVIQTEYTYGKDPFPPKSKTRASLNMLREEKSIIREIFLGYNPPPEL
jgi:hypothetical protein